MKIERVNRRCLRPAWCRWADDPTVKRALAEAQRVLSPAPARGALSFYQHALVTFSAVGIAVCAACFVALVCWR